MLVSVTLATSRSEKYPEEAQPIKPPTSNILIAKPAGEKTSHISHYSHQFIVLLSIVHSFNNLYLYIICMYL